MRSVSSDEAVIRAIVDRDFRLMRVLTWERVSRDIKRTRVTRVTRVALWTLAAVLSVVSVLEVVLWR